MQLHVTFYGVLKQDVGTKQQTLDLPDDALTVGGLAALLADRYPALSERLATVAFSVGDRLVGAETVLHDGDSAALLPPVSGG